MNDAPASASNLAAEVRSRAISVRASVSAALQRAEHEQRRLNAFTTVASEAALVAADALDARLQAGEDVGPLAGVPVVVKDNLCVSGVPASAGSQALRAFVPPYDATVVERLRAAGAVVIAKSNLDEFGIGATSEQSTSGPVRNPHDLKRAAGGSSGGSAAAVAAGVAPVALASDTGGSTRLPASYCGIYGLKPSYGGLSRYGLVAHASSLDQVGLMATNLGDLELLLTLLSGRDARDLNSVDLLEPEAVEGGSRPPRVGVIGELTERLSSAAAAAQDRALAQLEAVGAQIVELSLPSAAHASECYRVVVAVEAFSNLARYDGMLFGARAATPDGQAPQGQEDVMRTSRGQFLGYGPKLRSLFGALLLSERYHDRYYLQALRLREKLSRELNHFLESVDLIVTPAADSVAPELGEGGDETSNERLASLANLAGLPAVSVPVPAVPGELPLGVQLMGAYRRDYDLLRWASLLAPSDSRAL